MLIDGLIESNPEDKDALVIGARPYAVYAVAFVEARERAARLAAKARAYGERALCRSNTIACGLADLPFEQSSAALNKLRKKDVPYLYAFALAWLAWVRAESDDWSAVAALPKIEATLERVVALDKTFENGGPQLYLGILNSPRPPAMGGNPERGRECFEQAIAISGGKNLSIKVAYARYYARLVYDRELHDKLLEEVLKTDPRAPGLTLTNVLARQEAAALLESAGEYF